MYYSKKHCVVIRLNLRLELRLSIRLRLKISLILMLNLSLGLRPRLGLRLNIRLSIKWLLTDLFILKVLRSNPTTDECFLQESEQTRLTSGLFIAILSILAHSASSRSSGLIFSYTPR